MGAEGTIDHLCLAQTVLTNRAGNDELPGDYCWFLLSIRFSPYIDDRCCNDGGCLA
ncbi:MAG: hypothetical protein KatS3mg055_2122 [Chloroflexus sp.]|nr:MAG: hypothetical protein KatS3mg055_2122 [Chloroflexus sp.]